MSHTHTHHVRYFKQYRLHLSDIVIIICLIACMIFSPLWAHMHHLINCLYFTSKSGQWQMSRIYRVISLMQRYTLWCPLPLLEETGHLTFRSDQSACSPFDMVVLKVSPAFVMFSSQAPWKMYMNHIQVTQVMSKETVEVWMQIAIYYRLVILMLRSLPRKMCSVKHSSVSSFRHVDDPVLPLSKKYCYGINMNGHT